MRGGEAAVKRRKTVGFGGAPPPPPPSIEQHRQHFNSRDSDASFASSRPSSVGLGGRGNDDRSHQSSMIRVINAFLSAQCFPIVIRGNPVPSVKDITETLKFLLSALDYPCDSNKWDEDIVFFLRSHSCPHKITKSSLKAPNTPHNWPTILAVVFWLVEHARHRQHRVSNPTSVPEANSMSFYASQTYLHYIRGEDDLENALDDEFIGKLDAEKTNMAETISGCHDMKGELEAKLESLRRGPSKKESLERVEADLEKDVNKFRTIVVEYTDRIQAVEKAVEEKDKELKAKEEERERISQENKELKKSVELQNFSARDVERMRRELQAVERDVAEAEVVRDGWDQKAWELNSHIRNQFHQIQTLAIDCNQALRRLKLDDIQFVMKERGETPAAVMGVDYKSVVKPALCSLYDGIKGSSAEKVEELITLQHQMSEMASKMESKKSLLESVQLQISELEEKMRLVKKETQEFTTKCDMEAKTMVECVKTEAFNLEVVEKEAAEYLKASELSLQEAEKKAEEEVQACAAQLFAIIDRVSKHKEYMDSKISEIKTGVAKTARSVAEIYKASFKKHHAYYAQVAGLYYGVSLSDNGFELTLLGYNHKLRILLETVVAKIANFEVKPDRFAVIKETVTKEYQNYKFRQPYHQAMYYCSLILQDQTWPWTEELDVLSHMEAEDVAKFVPMLLSRTFIECYIAGNVENKEAESMVNHIEDVLFNEPKPICRPLFPSQHLTNRVVKLENGMKYFYHQDGSNPSDENSALVHYIQVHRDDFAMNIKLQLFGLVAKQATFHQLRTVEQLGYITALAQRNDSGIYGVQFIIQSSVKGPGHIDSRVESLLKNFESKLYEMSDEDFKSNVTALIDMKLEKHKNLKEESRFYWRGIQSGTLKFKEAES